MVWFFSLFQYICLTVIEFPVIKEGFFLIQCVIDQGSDRQRDRERETEREIREGGREEDREGEISYEE